MATLTVNKIIKTHNTYLNELRSTDRTLQEMRLTCIKAIRDGRRFYLGKPISAAMADLNIDIRHNRDKVVETVFSMMNTPDCEQSETQLQLICKNCGEVCNGFCDDVPF